MIANPYKVLGISENASQDEIKKAYRRLAKKYHPDLHNNDSLKTSKMNEINEAYGLLSERHGFASSLSGIGPENNGGYTGRGPFGPFTNAGFDEFFDHGRRTYAEVPKPKSGDDKNIVKAIKHIKAGEHPLAMEILNSIPQDKRDARWFYITSFSNFCQGNKLEAIEQIQKAIDMDSESVLYRLTHEAYLQATVGRQHSGPGHRTGGRISGFNKLMFLLRMVFLGR